MSEMNDINKPIAGFVIVILAAIFIGIIAGLVNTSTTKAFVANETLSIAGARTAANGVNASYVLTLANPVTGWKAGELADCKITNFALRNQSYITQTETTDYVLNQNAGTLTLVNNLALNSSGSNSTFVTYNYCGNDYLNSQFGRTTLKTVPGFLALMALVGMVALVYLLVGRTDKQ